MKMMNLSCELRWWQASIFAIVYLSRRFSFEQCEVKNEDPHGSHRAESRVLQLVPIIVSSVFELFYNITYLNNCLLYRF